MSLPVKDQIRQRYPWLGEFVIETAHAFVHDVIAVTTDDKRYALKLYRAGVRSTEDLEWEVGLTSHLADNGAPVVSIVEGAAGPIETLEVDGVERSVVMTEWALGEKPLPGDGEEPSHREKIYRLLGNAASTIHNVADLYVSDHKRAPLGAEKLLDEQVALLRPTLEGCGRWADVEVLVNGLRQFTTANELDWGICHNDLTLDNVHVDGDTMIVFDFDSARPTWRALEPALLYMGHASDKPDYWQAWLDGYRAARELTEADLNAIPLFSIMYQFENVAWKLGLTPTAVGQLLTPDELREIVDDWLAQYERATN